MKNWVTRVSSRMEHEPLHPPISQKMHWQPGLSFRHFNYTTIMENIRCSGASLTRISRSPVLPLIQGSAVSVVKSSPPAPFVGAPMENTKASSFIKGLALLGVMRTAGAPFERVKLLMQNQNEMIISGRLPKRYNGILDCFATTIRNEGILSLWRGNIAFVTAYLSSEVIAKAIQHYGNSREDIEWTHTRLQVAVFLSAVVNQFLVYPLYYAGTRMANDVITSSNSRERQFNGIFDVYRKTLKSDGIAGVYRGFNIMIPKIALLRAVTAVSKPWQQFLLHHFQGSVLGRAVVNTLYASCRSMAVHPLDTVSRRMMMTSGAVKYRHSLHAITCIFYNEGVKSFYSGAKAQILTLAVYQVYGLCLRYVVGVLRRKNTGDK